MVFIHLGRTFKEFAKDKTFLSITVYCSIRLITVLVLMRVVGTNSFEVLLVRKFSLGPSCVFRVWQGLILLLRN
jgi:hypothetical protein